MFDFLPKKIHSAAMQIMLIRKQPKTKAYLNFWTISLSILAWTQATNLMRTDVKLFDSIQKSVTIMDLDHMPASVCLTWVAFWMINWGLDWPESGEIHAIDGKDLIQCGNLCYFSGTYTDNYNSMYLQSKYDCIISNGDYTGHQVSSNCRGEASNQKVPGCAILSNWIDSFGDGFNQGKHRVAQIYFTFCSRQRSLRNRANLIRSSDLAFYTFHQNSRRHSRRTTRSHNMGQTDGQISWNLRF